MVWLGAIAGFVLWLIFSREGESFWTFVLAVTILGAILGVKSAGKARTFNRENYPKLRAEWENKWLCMKCGESYVQG